MSRASRPAGEGRLVVGQVRGLHGLRGGLRVEVLSDDPERFSVGSVLFAEGSQQPLTISDVRRDGPGLIVNFAELPDRTMAEVLRNSYLETESPGELPEGAYFWHEVEGCQVFATDGELLGRVVEVSRVGEAEVYQVRGPRGELLVPAVASVVAEFAPREGRLVVDTEVLGLERA